MALERVVLQDPSALLRTLAEGAKVSLDAMAVVDIWALVGLAALGRQGDALVELALGTASGASRFARAVGLEDVLTGPGRLAADEPNRTVRLSRVSQFGEVEPAAAAISTLLAAGPGAEETRETVYYVIVELLRNVVQHSQDPLGGVVAAQRMDERYGYAHPTIQVAVADRGIGIPRALAGHHPDLSDPEAALDKALWPHVSGTFPAGDTGAPNGQNAGLGLFFIAEMAKRTAGQLIIATRGATLRLVGDREGQGHHDVSFLRPAGLGYPGTLVGFELALGEVTDHAGLLEVIRTAARERTPQRAVQRWLRFGDAPLAVQRIKVSIAAEDTVKAEEFARDVLRPRLLKTQSVALDFSGFRVLTQSYAHSLLYEPIRLAWALRTEIYVLNAAPAVRSALEYLESYALGG